jgi:hypothetical protein
VSTTADLEFKDYYTERLYIDANVETGVIYNRSGRRMIALTNDFLIGLHRALEKECGDRVSEVLYTCGKRWGRNFGTGMDQEWSQFYETPAKEFPLGFFRALLVQEFHCNGWGRVEIDFDQFEKGVIAVYLRGAIMGELLEGKASYPADTLTAGILAGFFSYFFDREVDCYQSHSSVSQEEPSVFLLSSPERIGSIRAKQTGDGGHDQVLLALLQTTSN